MRENINMELGVQPLDTLMQRNGWSNNDIVNHSKNNFITHKQVQKARKGRRLTIKTQQKILLAVNAYSNKEDFMLKDLFTYVGKKDL